MNDISISGETLTIEDVVKVARQNSQVKLAPDAYDKIEASCV